MTWVGLNLLGKNMRDEGDMFGAVSFQLIRTREKLEALVDALSHHDNMTREADLEKAYSGAKKWLEDND